MLTGFIDMDRYLIICPVFDDWDAINVLINRLDSELIKAAKKADILIIDDASLHSSGSCIQRQALMLRAIKNIDVIRLRRNLGSQAAIAVGISYCAVNADYNALILMDADGEDLPEDVVRLIGEFEKQTTPAIIFASRMKRSEGYFFEVSYVFYRCIFRLLTGVSIRQGNFSIIPKTLIHSVVAVSDIWSHYSAGILKSKIPYQCIDTTRGKRIASHSKMNYLALFNHGMSAISVYSEVIGTRALFAVVLIGLFCLLLMVTVVAIRYFGEHILPGWATYVFGMLGIIMFQLSTLAVFFIILILNTRNKLLWLSIPDFEKLILNVKNLFPGSETCKTISSS